MTSRSPAIKGANHDVKCRRLGVQGVPSFVINGEVALSGAQGPKAFLDAFDRVSADGPGGDGGACTIGPGGVPTC